MSLRFFTDSSLSTLRDYTWEEFFNPTINNCRFSNERADLPDLTVEAWSKIQKQLYSRENILNNPGELIRQLGYHFNTRSTLQEVALKLINAVDPAHVHCLAFVDYAGRKGNGNNIFVIYTPGSRVRIADDGSVSYSLIDDYTETPALGTPECAELLKAKVAAIATRLDAIETTHSSKKMSNNVELGLTQLTAFVKYYLYDLVMYRHGIGSRNNNRPSELIGGLRDNSTTLSVTVTGVGDTSLVITERLSKNNKRPLHQLFGYSTSPMSLGLPWPITNKGETNPVLYGVELECATDYNVRQLIDATDEPFMIAKNDSSVSGKGSLHAELVTVPMSFRAHKREWAKWFSKLDYDKFDTTKNTSNGMHVHIGKKHFIDDKHIQRLAWFVNNPANKDFIFALSERTEYSLGTYAPLARFNTSTTKVSNYKNVTRVIGGMRGAINLGTGKPTVEVRLFRGIVSYAAIIKNLECVDAFFHFTAEANFNQLSLKGFLNWLEDTPPNKYAVFKKFIFKLPNFQDLVSSADLYDIIQNTEDPQQIIRIIEKKKFKVTNAHITVLNRRRRKRTFILDKETGSIRLEITDRSPLFHLDRQLETNQLRGAQQ